jgi:hypothetical protein
MDFGLEAARSRRRVPSDGGYDITSVVFHRRGQYDFNLTLHGLFVPPVSHLMDSTPPIEQPGRGVSGFSVLDAPLSANLEFGFDSPSQAAATLLDIVTERQEGHYETAANDPFLNNFDQENLDDIFNVDIPRRRIGFSDSLETNQIPSSPNSEPLFSDELNQDNPNEIFDIDISSLGIDFSNSVETNPNTPATTQNTRISSINLDQHIPNDSFDIDVPGQEINLSNSLEANPDVPTASQDTNFSSNEYDLTTRLSTPTRRPPATTPISGNSSPERHSCRLCSSTFKRPSDLKRHVKVHFPGQRKFHCRQLGCGRNGRKGYYRRDKLRDHERQVHGI